MPKLKKNKINKQKKVRFKFVLIGLLSSVFVLITLTILYFQYKKADILNLTIEQRNEIYSNFELMVLNVQNDLSNNLIVNQNKEILSVFLTENSYLNNETEDSNIRYVALAEHLNDRFEKLSEVSTKEDIELLILEINTDISSLQQEQNNLLNLLSN